MNATAQKPMPQPVDNASDTDLPEGWAHASLEDCATLITKGTTPTSYGFKYQSSGISFVRVENLSNGHIDRSSISTFIGKDADDALKRSRLAAGDLLFSIAGTIGRTALVRAADLPGNTNQALAIIRGTDRVFSPPFLRFALASSAGQQQAQSDARGGGMNNISLENVRSFRLPVPPAAEQKRIVAKVEELLTQVNAARDRLAKVPKILKRFRQSVLATACLGRLTEAWRTEQTDLEPASELVARATEIRQERYAQECKKAKSKGTKPPPEPSNLTPREVDSTNLPEVPEEWAWVYLPDLGYMNRGKSRNRPRNAPHLYGGPYPFIQTGDIAQSKGRITSHQQTYSDAGLSQSKMWRDGTVCITIAANIAHSAILTYPACFPDSVVGVITEKELCLPEYLEFFIRTARTNLEQFAPATAQKNINIAILSDVAVPIPPIEEQHEIVRSVEALFKLADANEKRVEAATKRADKLTQAILGKAFRGELVPTEAELARRERRTYEPASALLERIKAEGAVSG